MGTWQPEDDLDRFVTELLRTGFMLCELGSDLVEILPEDAYPGEEPGAVIVEMMCGTIRTALASADQRDVRRATELIVQAAERTVEHLRLASKLSARMNGGDGRRGRSYG